MPTKVEDSARLAANGLTAKPQQARRYHIQALALACQIGLPFEEARDLEGIGISRILGGNAPQASEPLHQALVIYQRNAAAAGGRVQETIRHHEAARRNGLSEPANPGIPISL